MCAMSTRSAKIPSKYHDCITGNEIDDLIDKDEQIPNTKDASDKHDPKEHLQCDGKINNVSFKTTPDSINLWKQSILNYFGEQSTSVLKDGAVIKVIFDSDCEAKSTVTINFYTTGSVVFQGARCSEFNTRYYEPLKQLVDSKGHQNRKGNKEPSVVDHEKSLTIPKTVETETLNTDEQNQNKTCDDSFKALNNTVEELKEIMNDDDLNNTVEFHPTKTNSVSTPKEKIALHQKTLDSRLGSINTVLDTIDTTLISFSDILVEIKKVAGDITPNISNKLNSDNKRIKEQLDNIEGKVKHTNQIVESLHVKYNTIDSKIKSVTDNQDRILATLTNLCENVGQLKEDHRVINEERFSLLNKKVDSIETKVNQAKCQHPCNTKTSVNTSDMSTQVEVDNIHVEKSTMNDSELTEHSTKNQNQVQKGNTNTVSVNKQTCDNLILSDSILKRIQARRFSPSEKTITKYVRGGANTCTAFVKKIGPKFTPKRVLVHVGARDIQSSGVKENEFSDLFETVTKMWPDAEIFVMHVLNRKDVDDETINEANDKISRAASKFDSVSLLNSFYPSDDMFFDHVHLNFSKGLPAIVRYIKEAMGIKKYNSDQNRPNRDRRRNRPHNRINEFARNNDSVHEHVHEHSKTKFEPSYSHPTGDRSEPVQRNVPTPYTPSTQDCYKSGAPAMPPHGFPFLGHWPWNPYSPWAMPPPSMAFNPSNRVHPVTQT